MSEKFCAKARAAKVLNEASVGGPILRVLVDEDWEMTMSRGGFRASSSLGAPNSATLCLFVGGAVEWDDDFKMYRFDIGSSLEGNSSESSLVCVLLAPATFSHAAHFFFALGITRFHRVVNERGTRICTSSQESQKATLAWSAHVEGPMAHHCWSTPRSS